MIGTVATGPMLKARPLPVEPAPRKAEQALRQEDDHHDEDDAERDQVGELIAEQPRQEFARELEETGADDRTNQGADAADDVVDYGGAGREKIDEVGRGKFVLYGVQHAGQSGAQGGQP